MKRPPPTNKREQRAKICFKPEQLKALEQINQATASHVIGIDEVGVGAIAGPIVVAGVVVPKGWRHPDVKDSKLLSQRQRSHVLEEVLRPLQLPSCILWRHALEIDEDGVALTLQQLTEGVALFLRRRFPEALVVQDGERPATVDQTTTGIVALAKADTHVPAVSAASILAKVARDEFMMSQRKQYPHWGFERNMGYPSQEHREGIAQFGLSPLHRRSYSTIKDHMRGVDVRQKW